MSFMKKQREQEETLVSFKKQKIYMDDDKEDVNRHECRKAVLNGSVMEQLPLQITAKRALLESEKLTSAVDQMRDEVKEKKSKVANIQQDINSCVQSIGKNKTVIQHMMGSIPKPKPPVYYGGLTILNDRLAKTEQMIEKLVKEKQALVLHEEIPQEVSDIFVKFDSLRAQQRMRTLRNQIEASRASYLDLSKVGEAYRQYEKDMLAWEKVSRQKDMLLRHEELVYRKMAILTEKLSKANEESAKQEQEYSKLVHESFSASEKVNQQLKLVLEQWEQKEQPPMSPLSSSSQALFDKVIKLEPVD